MLRKLGLKVFHASDLSNLWQITDKNLLYVTLARYVKYGLLVRIYKGLYSFDPPGQIDPVLLGYKAIHDFCYLSTETILFNENFINQKPSCVTFVGVMSKKFTIAGQDYMCRKMNDNFLFNPADISTNDGIPVASSMRAIADMMYFNPVFHFDKVPDWKKVKEMQINIGYPLTKKRYAGAKS
jgi:hypothetical protein